jgi:hypothetical protein
MFSTHFSSKWLGYKRVLIVSTFITGLLPKVAKSPSGCVPLWQHHKIGKKNIERHVIGKHLVTGQLQKQKTNLYTITWKTNKYRITAICKQYLVSLFG